MPKGIYKRIKKIIRKPHSKKTKERMRFTALKNRIPLKIRFWKKVKKTKTCWIWLGNKNSTTGYGVVINNKKPYSAHRLAYMWSKGQIPINLEIDHLCRKRDCVNPKHLEAVTHRENILRGMGVAAQNAKKIYCNSGHKFTKKNTYLRKKRFGRACKKCVARRSYLYIKKILCVT